MRGGRWLGVTPAATGAPDAYLNFRLDVFTAWRVFFDWSPPYPSPSSQPPFPMRDVRDQLLLDQLLSYQARHRHMMLLASQPQCAASIASHFLIGNSQFTKLFPDGSNADIRWYAVICPSPSLTLKASASF